MSGRDKEAIKMCLKSLECVVAYKQLMDGVVKTCRVSFSSSALKGFTSLFERMVRCKDVLCVITALVTCTIRNSYGIGTQDICGGYNGRRLYLELGSRGYVTAQNVTLPHRKIHSLSTIQPTYYNGSSHEQCTLELVTCPGCVVTVIFHHLNLSHQCSGVNSVMDSPCHCDYVWLSEPPYEDVSGVPFCGIHDSLPSDGPGVLTYRSSTRTLSIVFLYSEMHSNAFTFEYITERNRLFLKGYPRESSIPTFVGNVSHGGIIKSPFFPTLYPRDLGVEYIIACQPDLTVSCRVRILFHDFQIDVASIMEFYDWNGQRIEISTGTVFRPPVILSTGPSLMVRFYANGGTNLGYKATYSFLSGNLLEKNIKPDTDCGGYVENLGGAITMMNMVPEGIKTYDCVWLIRPPKNYLHLKTHLFLKVSTFNDMAGSTELQVLRGLTSEQPVLEMMRHPINQLLPHRNKEHIVPVDVGFYVSLRGTFGPASRLAIVYATFSYSDCFSAADTLCQNHRCIPSQLYCDGFDHCGDGSDEPSTCYQDWKTDTRDRHWYSHTPNYYFPKMERYPDLKTATLIFIISCLGLILLITALIILLYRMGSRVRNEREIQNHLQTISDLLVPVAANVALDGATSEDITPDEPPVYEAPPDYDDVIKVFINSTETERRKLRNDSGAPCTPMSSRHDGNSGPASLDNSRQPISENLTANGCLALSAPGLLSVALTNSYTPAITSRSCQTTPIPDSPPPPYSHADSISVVAGNVYDPATSFTITSAPLCFTSVTQNRKSKLKSGRGKKFCNAWLLSRDSLIRNLQETMEASDNSHNDHAAVPHAESNNLSLVGVHGSLCGNSLENGSLTSSDFDVDRNTDLNLAYQLQNEENEVNEQNLTSFSDQGSNYDSLINNEGENYCSVTSPMNSNDTSRHSWQSNNSNFTNHSRGSIASQNELDLRSDSQEMPFQCSCEGACGCATAWRNTGGENGGLSQSEVSSPGSSHDSQLTNSTSGSSKSSVSSNLIWISAESQDFL